MTNSEIPNRMDWQKVIHAYEAQPGNHHWRTCVLCGRGANAKIHDLSTMASAEPALPELVARHEVDGWWVTVRSNGQTRSPEAMVAWLERLGHPHHVAADHVGAAVVAATVPLSTPVTTWKTAAGDYPILDAMAVGVDVFGADLPPQPEMRRALDEIDQLRKDKAELANTVMRLQAQLCEPHAFAECCIMGDCEGK